jgi:hypothetical protein
MNSDQTTRTGLSDRSEFGGMPAIFKGALLND